MLVICEDCIVEMKIKKTGVRVRFNEDGCHTYSGDRYECPECGKTTTITAAVSYEDENPTYTDTDVWMDLKSWQREQKEYPTLDVVSLMTDTGCRYCHQRIVEFSNLHGTYHFCKKHECVLDNNHQAPSSPCDDWELNVAIANQDKIIDVDNNCECIQEEYRIDNK